ncbi:amidase [Penicillium canescens]|uniref:Amidase n=1 Tax=Penicillium canescens TaxID=5083 RepID=A0AAD6N9F3_PENCN|nr:amidase [Penicillium canescens]KAJ5996962.1 amidase [Penicillium canescens]KAJ6044218.1 amidase [Penicillium canescens]KAJ6055688.1 amidase [Penicillium canescens]KAJ6074638.1 amidase [Penicillium canescens]
MSAYITKRNLAAIVDSLDLYGIQQALLDQVFTSEDLVDFYTSRISQINDQLRAVTCTHPDTNAIAIQRNHERSNDQTLGPLHRILFVVKHTFITTEELDTTVGSHALVGVKYKTEPTVISKLNSAKQAL